jgi:hypothetical protein
MKYKLIVHWFYVPRDRSGNVYSYFAIADTRSGRVLRGKDAPESNLRAAIYHINGDQHKQNYWFAETSIPWRQFKYRTEDVPYIGCDPLTIAAEFRKMMKSRKKARA